MYKLLLVVLAAVLMVACASRAALLSRQEVISLANAAAESGGIELADYHAPEARYVPSAPSQWLVAYQYKVSMPGGWFLVTVDDRSKRTSITPGQ